MTYEERIALRILIDQARRQQVAQAHARNTLCAHCGEPFEPTKTGRIYCTKACGTKADTHRRLLAKTTA